MSTNKSDNLNFDELPDSKQYKSIDTAGVHTNMRLVEVEFKPREEKKKKNKAGELEATGEFISPYAKFTFRREEPAEQLVATMFSPPESEDEVKFVGDVYENNVAIRKRTNMEQIKHEFAQRFYFYEQLAKAWLVPADKFVTFKKSINVGPDQAFKLMFENFFKAFPLDKWGKNAIDLKAVWNNNKKAHTSFLQLAVPSSNNLIFSTYYGQNRPSQLALTPYEQKHYGKREFDMNARAPKTDETEVDGTMPEAGGFTPIATDEKELF